jgi:hypothetical protein
MTVDVFFWYVLPFIIAAAAFGWVAYDRSKDKDRHLRPGE